METNGAVRAIVGGRDYGQSQFNRATQAERQTGSSFKPYVYATAMEAGFEPDSAISDVPVSWGGWTPQNYSRGYHGTVTLATALIHSYNTVPVRLARDHLGIGPIQDLVAAMGVESELNGHKTMVLGTSGMTVMDQATGYSVFANGGFSGTRHGILQMRTHAGDIVYNHAADAEEPRRVLSPKAVSSMNSILVQVPERGTGRRAAIQGVRSAGKTGTTQSYRDGWYVGYTGNYVAAVWLGNDNYEPSRRMTGGSLPAMVWQRFMAYAHQNIELKPIPGIENPLPETDRSVVASTSNGNGEETNGLPVRAMPPATTRVLKEMAERFRRAPPLESGAPAGAVSAL